MSYTEYKELEQKIIDWAEEKELFTRSSAYKQIDKLFEEAQELKDAIYERDKDEMVDRIGYCVEALIILAAQEGLTLNYCLQKVYNVIKKRTGKIIKGFFVKDKK